MENKIDITRLNRKERRSWGKQNNLKVQGRNLPFKKSEHLTLVNYYAKRKEEVDKERSVIE